VLLKLDAHVFKNIIYKEGSSGSIENRIESDISRFAFPLAHLQIFLQNGSYEAICEGSFVQNIFISGGHQFGENNLCFAEFDS
jgi:hypothetical protein